MLLLTGRPGASARDCCRCCWRRRGRPLPGARAAPAGRAPGRRADRARRPRRDVGPLSGAPGAARGRHGDPPGGDDPRPAAAPDRGAERAGDGAAAAGGGAQRRAPLRLLQRPQRLAGPAHPLLPRQVAGRAGGRAPRRWRRRSSRPRSSTTTAIPGSPCCGASRSCRCCRSPATARHASSRSGPRTRRAAWSRRWPARRRAGPLRAGRARDAHLRRDVGPGQPHRRPAAAARPPAAAADPRRPACACAPFSARPCLQPGRRQS